MNKYIDPEKLKERIEKLDIESCISEEESGFYYAIESVLEVLNSLLREQPEFVNEIWHKVSEDANLTRPVVLSDGDKYMSPPCTFPFKDMSGFVNAMNKKYKADYTIWAYMDELLNIPSLQQKQPEENKLPSKRTRVNYAICKLQSFKPLREAIVLDGYVYDEGKCYRENLLNYIHAIPESRLAEIRSYLKETGWWPYDDDSDWGKQEQPEVDLDTFDKEVTKMWGRCAAEPNDSIACLHIETFNEVARHFYELGKNVRKEEQI